MSEPDMLTPNGDRLQSRVDHLATIVDAALPPFTRRAFSETHLAGRRWLADQFSQAGLTVSTDAGGNLIGRRESAAGAASAIAMGSHSDTVIGGGRFDGIAGVLTALEVAQTLGEGGKRLHHTLEVIDFLCEEPSDYGASCIGSRALAGNLSQEMLSQEDSRGETLREAILRTGGDPDQLGAGPLRGKGEIAAFLELHIEQGPVLEERAFPLGVVTGIVCIHRHRLIVTGQADHAGTTPMSMRRDALVGAAGIIGRVNALARERAERDGLVATVGRAAISPNMQNVVPAEVSLIVEARSLKPDRVEAFFAAVIRESKTELEREGLQLQAVCESEAAPAQCDPRVRGVIRAAAEARGHRFLEMQSGAGHDTMQMALHWPAGMIFVPSQNGRSHAAQEYTSPDALAIGAEVMLETVIQLDRTLSQG